MIIPAQFEDVGDFSCGLAPVKLKNKWGYIDKKGNLVVPYQFDDVGLFNNKGVAVVVVGKKRKSIMKEDYV